MKILPQINRRRRAFTFTEMMVTTALGLVVIGGTLTLQLVGGRMFQYTQTKLGGTFQHSGIRSLEFT